MASKSYADREVPQNEINIPRPWITVQAEMPLEEYMCIPLLESYLQKAINWDVSSNDFVSGNDLAE